MTFWNASHGLTFFCSLLSNFRLYFLQGPTLAKPLLSYHPSQPSLRYVDEAFLDIPGTCQVYTCLRDSAPVIRSAWVTLSPDMHMVNNPSSVFIQLSVSQEAYPDHLISQRYILTLSSSTSSLLPSYTPLTLFSSFYCIYHPRIFYITPVLFC